MCAVFRYSASGSNALQIAVIRPKKVAQSSAHAGADLTKTASINSANLPVNKLGGCSQWQQTIRIKLSEGESVDGRI